MISVIIGMGDNSGKYRVGDNRGNYKKWVTIGLNIRVGHNRGNHIVPRALWDISLFRQQGKLKIQGK